MTRCIDCDALRTCPICETCEHCLSGGSGACVDAHDDWLGGGPGGLVEVVASARPDGVKAKRVALLLAQDELAKENGLRRCARCRGLEDPAALHSHAD